MEKENTVGIDNPNVRSAFDPENFRRMGHRAVDLLADHLCEAQADGIMPAIPWRNPEEMETAWPSEFPVESTEDLVAFLSKAVAASTHLQHPRYMGHQVSAPLPMAALCDLTAGVLNSGTVVYEMGPAGTGMEHAVTQWMARQVGFGSDADGVLTSGGSLANLTALLAARQVQTARCAGRPPALLVSDQAHYSVLRSVRAMGWGNEGAEIVPTDEAYHLRTDLLEERFSAAEARGRCVIGVVASACSTACGAYDNLNAVADFSERHGLWMHVDAAHGGSALLSKPYRHLLSGIERADSVTWDAHKMMMIPGLVSAVLFRDGAHAYAAFEEEASYLFARKGKQEAFNLGHRTLECTKPMLALKVYATLRCHGTRLFGEHVTSRYTIARRFAEMLDATDDFEVPVRPESNVVCFRYRPDNAPADMDAFQSAIRRVLIEDGRFYIVQTQLKTGLHLRVTLINPFTDETHLVALLTAIRVAGQRVTGSGA